MANGFAAGGQLTTTTDGAQSLFHCAQLIVHEKYQSKISLDSLLVCWVQN
jgi:hypothetical protein